MINPYYALAQNFIFLSPTIYKTRFYKKYIRLSWQNVFEREVEPEVLWLKEFLNQKSVFIDVGAGTGDYVYFLDYLLFPENIHAFEPNRKHYKRLKRLFPKSDILPFALSDESKAAMLNIPMTDNEEHPENGTLRPISESEGLKVKTQKTEVTTLDEWAEKKELEKLDFIKIDVAGQELDVLKGAEELIEKFRPVLMVKIEQEFHEENIWDIITQIAELGYAPHYLDRDSFTLKPLSEEFINSQNAIFAKDDKYHIKNIIFLSR